MKPCQTCKDPVYCVSIIQKCENEVLNTKYKVEEKIKHFEKQFEIKTKK